MAKGKKGPTGKKAAGKKAAARGARPKAAAPKSRAAATGPVTLAQARALVEAKSPVRATREIAGTKEPAVTLASVAEERNRLDERIQAENERRIRDYKATMTIMKSRGVRGLAPRGPGGVPVAPEAAEAQGQPLQIFAEGDSWFDYPAFLISGGGVIPRLEKRLGVPILNLAKAGDEVRNMLGVEERKILTAQLKNGSPAGGRWDVLLFSGGGNDIVGNPMALWVKDFNPAIPPADLISPERFGAALELVRAGYEDLITLRDTLSPSTRLVFHSYDFAIPDGRGICNMGPWLKPTFDLRRFPSLAPATAVVRSMLLQFAAALQKLATSHDKVTFINTQGTLVPQPSSWHNELHPSRDGFNKIADLFRTTLKSLFPGRVL